jgi:hypothetical protein
VVKTIGQVFFVFAELISVNLVFYRADLTSVKSCVFLQKVVDVKAIISCPLKWFSHHTTNRMKLEIEFQKKTRVHFLQTLTLV